MEGVRVPVDHVHDAKENVLYVRPYGILTVPEVVRYLETIMDDETISAPATEVVRFRDVEDFEFAGIKELPHLLPRLKKEGKLRATVFVADDTRQALVGTLMKMLLGVKDRGYPTRVVRDERELRLALHELNRL
jgi:hypothetical protein